MTPIDRFERRLPDELHELAAERFPDYTDDLLARTARTRQRPAWSLPMRWLPMTIALRRPLLAPPLRLLAVGLALLLALLAVMALAPILAGPTPMPAVVDAPRQNGQLAFSVGGVLWRAEPAESSQAPFLQVSADGPERSPAWSPDGTRLAFWRRVGGQDLLVATDASGATETVLTPDGVVDPGDFRWSPDGSRIAFVGSDGTVGTVFVANADGSGVTALMPGTDADRIAWRPDGQALLVRWGDPAIGALLSEVTLEGVVGTPIAQSDPDSPLVAEWQGGSDFYGFAYSPDGTRIAYTSGVDLPDEGHGSKSPWYSRSFVMARDGSGVTMLSVDPLADDADGVTWSPDGTRLSTHVRHDSDHQLAVFDAADLSLVSTTEPEVAIQWIRHAWSPDSTTILAWRSDLKSSFVDAATGARTPASWAIDEADWQPLPG